MLNIFNIGKDTLLRQEERPRLRHDASLTRVKKSTIVDLLLCLARKRVQLGMIFQGLQERGERDLEGRGNQQQRPNGDIRLPVFNRADVGACQSHACGEHPLGQATSLPKRANGGAQELESLLRTRSLFSHDGPIEERTDHDV